MPASDLFAAVRWWAVLLLIGLAATPLTLYLFRRLADRGYAFTKLVGLLLLTYLFWLLGSFGLVANNGGGILLALVTLSALSFWVQRKTRGEQLLWLREHRRQVVLTELLFGVIFAIWVWVRTQNPAIVATEKPMEFAFLNAVGRSSTFPPLDPWLSGFAISYYYFGYVMASALARMAMVTEAIAFNLTIAWLVAGTAVATFGVVYNLVTVNGSRRSALALGLIAAVALPIAGNLEIGLEVMHAAGVGSDRFWQQLDIRDLNGPAEVSETPRYLTSGWWWWRSSRVIHEYHLSGRPEDGLEPIAEFPGFSFVLGDMHPHVLALPFAFLSLAVALSWWLREGSEEPPNDYESWLTADWPERVRMLIAEVGVPQWIFTVILLGGLSFLNTWDVLIHLFILLGAFLLGRWRSTGWQPVILAQSAAFAGLLLVPAVLLYLPFYVGFRSQAGPPYLLPMLMRPTRLAHFLVIFGMPLWSILILLLRLGFQQRFRHWKTGVTAAVILITSLLILMFFLGWIIASSQDGAARVASLANELGLSLSPRPEAAVHLGWGLSAIIALTPTILGARIAYPALLLLLSGMIALIVMVWRRQFECSDGKRDGSRSAQLPEASDSVLPFVLLLILTGALLALGPEFVYLRDNFGMRLNTIFKFYYQAWILFGIAALYALDYLWRDSDSGRQRLLPALATFGYAALMATGLLFPYYAVRSRAAEYRGPTSAEVRHPPTLDGLAQIQRLNPDEYKAITWLRENGSPEDVILEAVGGQYTGYARVSASTGLPTVLGWAGHELQWRGSGNPEPVLRDPAASEAYSGEVWSRTAEILDQYEITFVYVGNLELSTYGPVVLEKFDGRLPVAYANDSVTIYRWRPR